ncbi:MAG: hypothetical protein DRR00_33160 [Candidatus Parabeggiatoa sp. nov. 3]|nr:MAG: hypothetical protein DRR00_33160 [Gammaproteobacteria bacterium]
MGHAQKHATHPTVYSKNLIYIYNKINHLSHLFITDITVYNIKTWALDTLFMKGSIFVGWVASFCAGPI